MSAGPAGAANTAGASGTVNSAGGAGGNGASGATEAGGVAGGLGMAGSSAGSAGASAARQPNIIYILADDLGYGDLGAYGQQQIKTPRLDQMANEGLRFTDHYAGNTVCAPSRVTLLTGLHSGHAVIRDNMEVANGYQQALPAESLTAGEVLQAAGYKTGLIGKWGLGGPGTTGTPNTQGFDYFYGYLSQVEAHNYYPARLWRNEQEEALDGKTYSHDLLTNDALAFIEASKSAPFFLYLAYAIPHSEIEVPELGAYAQEPWSTNMKTFAAMVTRLDRDVGAIMDRLTELELDENTLLVFSSDNGPHQEGGHMVEDFDSNGALRGFKRSLTEGGIRVPMLARWPGVIRPGQVTAHASYFPDVLPTFCDLAGVASPSGLDGLSFAPLLRGEPQAPHDYQYWEWQQLKAVREGKWKAISTNGGPVALYDLATDPGESTNLAGQNAAVASRLQASIAAAHTDGSPLVTLP